MEDNRSKFGGIMAVTVFAFVLGTVMLGQVLLGVVGAAIILGATAEFWLGTRYRIDEKGVRSQTGASVTAMEWSEVKRVIVETGVIRVSPLEAPSWRDNFRGVTLKVTPELKPKVVELVGRFTNLV